MSGQLPQGRRARAAATRCTARRPRTRDAGDAVPHSRGRRRRRDMTPRCRARVAACVALACGARRGAGAAPPAPGPHDALDAGRAAGGAHRRRCGGCSSASARVVFAGGAGRASLGALARAARRRRHAAGPRACDRARARAVRAASPSRVGVSALLLLVPDRRERLDRPRARAPAARATRCTSRSPAHQWWWEVALPTASPDRRRFTTANELHMPVGRPVVHRAAVGRRDPQLLGAEPARQEGPDPGPHARRCSFRADQAGRLPRPVRRVLRPPAREHGASWSSPSRRSSFEAWADAAARSEARRADDRRAQARAARCSSAAPA